MYTRNYRSQKADGTKNVAEKEREERENECENVRSIAPVTENCRQSCEENAESSAECPKGMGEALQVGKNAESECGGEDSCESKRGQTTGKRRFRAVRVPRERCFAEGGPEQLCVCPKEPTCEAALCDERCEEACEVAERATECRGERGRCPKSAPHNPISSLFSSFCSDELLVLALVVLLLLEGGDEILIFALLFVLS